MNMRMEIPARIARCDLDGASVKVGSAETSHVRKEGDEYVDR